MHLESSVEDSLELNIENENIKKLLLKIILFPSVSDICKLATAPLC